MPRKILSLNRLLLERARLRAAGQKLVFTNGVFDILHVGHVRYLEQARALGDRLLVAVNSDATVRELKGQGRPLMNQDERAEILAALRTVDYVTIFDDDTPSAALARLRPDVHVKDEDYRFAPMPEREIVEAAGGRIEFCVRLREWSTTSLVEVITAA